jgi:hypothetical protein
MRLLGILVALGLLIWLAYRGWSILLLAPAGDHRWFPLGPIRLDLPETNCFLNAFTVHALTYLCS